MLSLFTVGTCCAGSQALVSTVVCGIIGELEWKLTDIEVGPRCYSCCASYCRLRVSKPNKRRHPLFKKLPCVFISLHSRLGKICDYGPLKLIFPLFSISHFIEDIKQSLNMGPWHANNALQFSVSNKPCI